MKSRFESSGTNNVVLVVEPDHGTEAMLMAMLIKYDTNVFTVSVERYEDGQIKQVAFFAGSDR